MKEVRRSNSMYPPENAEEFSSRFFFSVIFFSIRTSDTGDQEANNGGRKVRKLKEIFFGSQGILIHALLER